jgi:hypothetical protein
MSIENSNMNDDDDFKLPELNIRQENEFKKMKMNLESGAIFPDDLSKNLPPEVESQFLDSIMLFEKAFRDAKQVIVFEKIGSPNFIPENVLNDNEVKIELERIEEIMHNNGLNLDVLADYDDEERLIYKFITEELFFKEVDDIKIPEYNINFIYEEFYRNDKYELKQNTVDFLNMLFHKKSQFYEEFHYQDAINHVELNNFRSLFKKIKIKLFEVIAIDINNENAIVHFNIDFFGKKKKSDNKIYFSGEGSISYFLEDGLWKIQTVNIPINN